MESEAKTEGREKMREESSSNYKQGLHRARWLPNCSQGVPTLGKVGWDWEKKTPESEERRTSVEC